MKKRFALCLCLTLVLSLAACGSAQPEVTIIPTEAPAATTAPTAEPVADVIAAAFTAVLFFFQFRKAIRHLEIPE